MNIRLARDLTSRLPTTSIMGNRSSSSKQIVTSTAFLVVLFCLVSLVPNSSALGVHKMVKRALYELPAGADHILGPNIRTTFSCDGLGYGYYADLDNDCKIFHVCQSFRMPDGSLFNNHWSFMCGNETIFNQVSLACSHPEESVPCESARDFYYVNDYFGDVRSPSVKESDLIKAQDLVSRAYGSRISGSSKQ